LYTFHRTNGLLVTETADSSLQHLPYITSQS